MVTGQRGGRAPQELRRALAAARWRLRYAAGRATSGGLRPWRRKPFPVRSFDVFDTVLTRTVAPPAAVFLLVGRAARRSGLVDLESGDFARARVAAETAARTRRPSGEVSLREIHDELGRALGVDPDTAERLRLLELAVERRVLVPVPGMVERLAAARSAGSAVAFVSDMYLDSTEVVALLGAGGLHVAGDHCLVSHEHDATKAGGRLYDLLLDQVGCRPAQVAHLGDNRRSDVERARRRGVVASLYDGTAPNRYEAILAGAGEETGGLSAAMAGASRLARLGTPAATAHQRSVRDVAAGVAAPALCGLVLWALERARALGLERLCFASRDGQVLLAVAEDLAPRLGVDVELRYLHGGRQAWGLPGLAAWAEGGDALPAWVTEDGAFETAAGVLARVGLVPADLAAGLEAAGLPAAGWHRRLATAGIRAVAGALAGPAARRLIGEAAARAEADLVAYLDQEGLLGPAPWGVVDLGWRGQATGALAAVVERAGGARPHQFYAGLHTTTVAVPAGHREAWLFESPVRPARPARVEAAFEAFCAGDHGVVLGYHRDGGGRLAPVLRSPDNPAVAAWGLPVLREAVRRFAASLLVDDDLVDPRGDLRAVVTRLLDAFWTTPTAGEARAWGAFPYEGDARGTQVRPLAPAVGRSTLRRPRTVLRSPHWPAGEARRSSPVALALVRRGRQATRR